jgi:hypothetical protein
VCQAESIESPEALPSHPEVQASVWLGALTTALWCSLQPKVSRVQSAEGKAVYPGPFISSHKDRGMTQGGMGAEGGGR